MRETRKARLPTPARHARFRPQTCDAKVFADLRRELAALPNDAPYAEWGRWFLADRATRPIAPGFTIMRTEAEQLAKEMAAPPATPAPRQ